jgi:Asp-tRNA(Asn)/Glu-tRNA(Gln) amidotransferase B subunit
MKLSELVSVVLAENPEHVEMTKQGKPYLGFLVGRVMQAQLPRGLHWSPSEVQVEILHQLYKPKK